MLTHACMSCHFYGQMMCFFWVKTIIHSLVVSAFIHVHVHVQMLKIYICIWDRHWYGNALGTGIIIHLLQYNWSDYMRFWQVSGRIFRFCHPNGHLTDTHLISCTQIFKLFFSTFLFTTLNIIFLYNFKCYYIFASDIIMTKPTLSLT